MANKLEVFVLKGRTRYMIRKNSILRELFNNVEERIDTLKKTNHQELRRGMIWIDDESFEKCKAFIQKDTFYTTEDGENKKGHLDYIDIFFINPSGFKHLMCRVIKDSDKELSINLFDSRKKEAEERAEKQRKKEMEQRNIYKKEEK